jgi:2-amino-4-hydroxy-6-hydroxymethyldihydropteridine diphosphokinase
MPLHAYIGLGSNLGDRAGNLLSAIQRLTETGMTVSRLSRIYETEPVETFPQPAFLNMVVELDAASLPDPLELMARLLEIEQALGRIRDVAQRNNPPRTIDLDLLLYGEESRNTESLILPHPRFHQRRFVLVPLAELAPDLLHPTFNRTMQSLLDGLDDFAAVTEWRP